MKYFKKELVTVLLGCALIFSGCSSLNKTQQGGIAGTATGAAIGGIAGKTAGNTALGTIIGAAVGGTAGVIIGQQMDKQAREIKSKVPGVEVVRVEEGIIVEFSNKVLFGFDESNLSKKAQDNLDNLVIVLNDYPDTDIVVQGHTDSDGSVAYNQNLSEERSSRVATYLKAKGISSSRITAEGFGELLPKYLNNTEDGRDKNRRVEFVITANEVMKANAADMASK